MTDEKTSYRQVFKATTVFGGVQIFNILISIVRSKIIAVLVGPVGVGIQGLFTNSLTMIVSLTNLGLSSSAVRDISGLALENEDNIKLTKIIKSFRKLLFGTSILAMIIAILFCKQFSILTFGNSDYIVGFAWLSIGVFFQIHVAGQYAVLQGLRKIKELAMANLIGALAGLCITVPLYFFFGVKGILPTIIILTVISFIINLNYVRKIKLNNEIKVGFREAIIKGRDMIKLGVLLNFSGIAVTLASYFIVIFINKFGGSESVGLYQAGWAIINGYVGIVFTAMAADYFPRLSAVQNDNNECRLQMNYQAEIAILILTPILVFLLTVLPFAIRLLYSDRFLGVIPLIQWASIGLIFRAVSWSISFLIPVKGHGFLFFIIESTFSLLNFIFSIIGFYFMGIEGVGIAFCLLYVLYLITLLIVTHKRYKFYYTRDFYNMFFILLIPLLLVFILSRYVGYPITYFIGIIVFIFVCVYSIKKLDARLGLKQVFQKRFKKP